VDQEADPGDEQHEDRGQRVEQQPERDLQLADVEERVQRPIGPAVRAGPAGQAAQREEIDQPEDERDEDTAHAEPVPPPVGPPAEQQQDRRAGQRDRDQQPDAGQRPARGCVVHEVRL
jgi:hypothetical protein